MPKLVRQQTDPAQDTTVLGAATAALIFTAALGHSGSADAAQFGDDGLMAANLKRSMPSSFITEEGFAVDSGCWGRPYYNYPYYWDSDSDYG